MPSNQHEHILLGPGGLPVPARSHVLTSQKLAHGTSLRRQGSAAQNSGTPCGSRRNKKGSHLAALMPLARICISVYSSATLREVLLISKDLGDV